MRRNRDAPSAARVAISRCRVVARASRRFAKLAQAMSRTQATPPRRIIRTARMGPVSVPEKASPGVGRLCTYAAQRREASKRSRCWRGLREGDAGFHAPMVSQARRFGGLCARRRAFLSGRECRRAGSREDETGRQNAGDLPQASIELDRFSRIWVGGKVVARESKK